jgi:hypothetical protein
MTSLSWEEVELNKIFPHEHLCCNGDYCEAKCDEKKREKILKLFATRDEELVEKLEGMRKNVPKNDVLSLIPISYNQALDDVLSAIRGGKQDN